MKYFHVNSARIKSVKYRIDDEKLEIEEVHGYDTLDAFLDAYCQSRKNKYLLVQNKQLLLNDMPVTSLQEPLQGKLTLLFKEEDVDWAPAENECKVVYEDAFLYIVHKDPGIIIHSSPEETNCLNALAARYQLNHHIHAPVRPIHRLDEDTQGLVLYSKIPFFQPWFDKQLAEKKIHRTYLAICTGNCAPGTKMTIHEPLGRDRHNSNRYRISPTGKDALTKVTCLDQKGPYVLMKCELETGRTHQIRVHLASKNFPIVNDPLYGTRSRDFKEMDLWAYEIEFRNPLTNKKHKIHDFRNEDYDYFRKDRKNYDL